jgi:hypothetical protein
MKFFNCVDNYIDNKICDKYIEIYQSNIGETYKYSNTNPLKIEPNKHSEQIQIDFNIKLKLDNLEIVKREKGSFMDNHYDEGDDIAFIVYLNDNYEGGHTVIENETSIVPKKGRILVFSNGKLLHKVTEIKQGTRYILAGWFVNQQ